MKLFHGTTAQAAEEIVASGFLRGPVFLTARRDVAEDYAGYGEVIVVHVADGDLMVDLDMPGARLLSVADAAAYLGEDSATNIEWFIERGYSVGVTGDIEL